MSKAPALSVVIVSWNTRELLRECLESILRAPRRIACEVVVVDNASADGSADLVADAFPEVVLVRNSENAGFAIGSNLGIARATGRHVLLLNTDTRVLDDALERLVAYLDAHPDCGAVAAQLVDPDGSIQRACTRLPGWRTPLWLDTPLGRRFPRARELVRYRYLDWDHADSRDVEQPPGNGLAIPRELLTELGPLDEDLFVFYVDVELCHRIRDAGYRIHFLAEARIVHHVGKSTEQLPTFAVVLQADRVRYYRKRFGRLAALYVKAVVAVCAGDYLLRRAWPPTRLRRETHAVSGVLRRILAA